MSRESQSADRPNNVSSVLQPNSFVEKAYVTLATSGYGTRAWWGKTKDIEVLSKRC